MVFKITESILEELCQQAEQQSQISWLDTETDTIDWGTLTHLGKFRGCYTSLSKDLAFFLEEIEVATDLLFFTPEQAENPTEMSLMFHLSGNVQTRHHGLTEEITEFVGYYHLERSNLPETELWMTETPFRRLYLHFKPWQLFGNLTSQEISQLPLELHHTIEGNHYSFYPSQPITPKIHQVLQQILHCPYAGILKLMYLKGKAWELLTLCFESLLPEATASQPKTIKPSEVEKIYYAKEILISHLNNPPSLLNLARQANLNDFALKQGFKQVFGTTVFGYLHNHRLQIARQLLATSELRSTEISQQVGFANRGYFAQAFRKKFGLNPKEYRQQQK